MGQGDICKDNVIVAGTDATLWYEYIYNNIIYLENIQLIVLSRINKSHKNK